MLLLYFGVIFQLTPSRRATTVNVSSLIVTVISTHALTEGDELLPACAEPAEKFQLTPSRRATITLHARLHFHFISTHALTEGDSCPSPARNAYRHFNSRPHGGRQFFLGIDPEAFHFNSRPHGGRRSCSNLYHIFLHISTHALTEGDPPPEYSAD